MDALHATPSTTALTAELSSLDEILTKSPCSSLHRSGKPGGECGESYTEPSAPASVPFPKGH